jgi:hypothetical protein
VRVGTVGLRIVRELGEQRRRRFVELLPSLYRRDRHDAEIGPLLAQGVGPDEIERNAGGNEPRQKPGKDGQHNHGPTAHVADAPHPLKLSL